MSVRFEMRLPDELATAVDGARGREPRASWLRAAAEEKLARDVVGVEFDRALEAESSDGGPVASPRAPGDVRVPLEEPGKPTRPQFNRAASLGGAARPIPRRS